MQICYKTMEVLPYATLSDDDICAARQNLEFVGRDASLHPQLIELSNQEVLRALDLSANSSTPFSCEHTIFVPPAVGLWNLSGLPGGGKHSIEKMFYEMFGNANDLNLLNPAQLHHAMEAFVTAKQEGIMIGGMTDPLHTTNMAIGLNLLCAVYNELSNAGVLQNRPMTVVSAEISWAQKFATVLCSGMNRGVTNLEKVTGLLDKNPTIKENLLETWMLGEIENNLDELTKKSYVYEMLNLIRESVRGSAGSYVRRSGYERMLPMNELLYHLRRPRIIVVAGTPSFSRENILKYNPNRLAPRYWGPDQLSDEYILAIRAAHLFLWLLFGPDSNARGQPQTMWEIDTTVDEYGQKTTEETFAEAASRKVENIILTTRH